MGVCAVGVCAAGVCAVGVSAVVAATDNDGNSSGSLSEELQNLV